jgi:hypothetical protein
MTGRVALKRALALAIEARRLFADHKALGVSAKDPQLRAMGASIAAFLRSR